MQVLFRDIEAFLEREIPVSFAETWDNVGVMVGRKNKNIKRVLLCLDATKEVLKQAIDEQYDLIVSHHPFIFHPLKSVAVNGEDDFSPEGIVFQAAAHGICVYSAHTNLDSVMGGVNCALAKAVGLQKLRPYDMAFCEITGEKKNVGLTVYGELPEAVSLRVFAERVKKALCIPMLQYTGPGERKVQRAAVFCGSFSGSAGEIPELQRNVDVVVTGELKYSMAVTLQNMDLCAVAAGHYGSERVVLPVLRDMLKANFSELTVEINNREDGVFQVC